MHISSTGISNGTIADRFGKRGHQLNDFGKCTYSLPFDIHDAPAGTVSFAFVLEDVDAVPVCGFSWIHWLGCNLTEPSVPENSSVKNPPFTQGANSWISTLAGSRSIAESSVYGGMAPPDRPHTYELHVYALDTTLNLAEGFLLNELRWAMRGHIIASATLEGMYDV